MVRKRARQAPEPRGRTSYACGDRLPARPGSYAEPPRQSGARPLWKELPSWFLFGSEDRSIPAATQHFMAERAGARDTIEIPGASHAIPVSHPDATAQMILEAARRLWRDSALGIAA
jgi:pimeloyl-ACP methyl ester carboxylesterase